MRVVRYFFRRYPGHSLIVVACLILASVFEAVGLGTLLPLLSIMTGTEGGNSPLEETAYEVFEWLGFDPGLEELLVVIAIAFSLKTVLVILAKRQVGYTVAYIATDLRLTLLRTLMKARWGYYTRQSVGAVANSMATEAARASSAYLNMTLGITYGIEMLLYAGIAVMVSWQATIGAALAGFMTVAVLSGFVRMSLNAGARQTKLLRVLLGRLTDALHAVKLLKATGRESLIEPLLATTTRKLNITLRRQVLSKEMLRALQEWIRVMFACGGIYGAKFVFDMALPEIIVLVVLFSSTLSSNNKLQRKYQAMVTEATGLWALLDMTETAEGEAESFTGTRTPHLEREVALQSVSVRYEGLDVLRDLSIEIPAGQLTAIIGPSGSGKTTIVDLITGLRQPDAGRVCVDGTALADLDVHRWRQSIGYVPQETLILNDTIAKNVTLGDPEITETQLENALRDAGASEFVARLPEGAASNVGERGSLLSSGQRQRIAIARALVHGTRLLILDEATAALDPESEAAVWETVARLRGRITVVAISHQPALMAVADRVYRIEDGRAHIDPRRPGSTREVA